MNKIIAVLVLAGVFCSCANSGNNSQQGLASDSSYQTDEKLGASAATSWPDSMVIRYLRETGKDTTTITSLLDRMERADTATYYVFQVGHATETSMVTENWLYIDSARRILFEYDVAEDKLNPWYSQ